MAGWSRRKLAEEIYKISYLTGTFKLRSGQVSNEYFDKYRFEAQPRILREIVAQMSMMIPAQTEVLAGLEMGGIPIATALSLHTGIPVLFVRKAAKDYGTSQFAEGLDVKGKRVCIIEDVVTTGGQVVLSTKDLRGIGAQVMNVMCVIERGPVNGPPTPVALQDAKLELYPLFRMADLKP